MKIIISFKFSTKRGALTNQNIFTSPYVWCSLKQTYTTRLQIHLNCFSSDLMPFFFVKAHKCAWDSVSSSFIFSDGAFFVSTLSNPIFIILVTFPSSLYLHLLAWALPNADVSSRLSQSWLVFDLELLIFDIHVALSSPDIVMIRGHLTSCVVLLVAFRCGNFVRSLGHLTRLVLVVAVLVAIS